MRYVPAHELADLINVRLGRWAADSRWGARAGCDGRVVLSHRAAAEIERRLSEPAGEIRVTDTRRSSALPPYESGRERITWRPDVPSD
jgi:hypothetical protein